MKNKILKWTDRISYVLIVPTVCAWVWLMCAL